MPSPPITANTGTSTPRTRTLNGARYQASSCSTSTSPGQLAHRLRARRQRSADQRDVRDRERQHRAERVERAEELGLPRDHHDARDRAEHARSPTAGVRKRGLIRRSRVGQLLVLPHRVRQPADAEDAGVRRDQQDRRGQDADVVLAPPSGRRRGPCSRRSRGSGRRRRWSASCGRVAAVAVCVTGSADSATAGRPE